MRAAEYAARGYLEDRGSEDQVHFTTLKKLSGDQVELACYADFKIEWRVKSMWL